MNGRRIQHFIEIILVIMSGIAGLLDSHREKSTKKENKNVPKS